MAEQDKKCSFASAEEETNSSNQFQERVNATAISVENSSTTENTGALSRNEGLLALKSTRESSTSVSNENFTNDEASSDETKNFSAEDMEDESVSFVASNGNDETNSKNMKNINLKYYRDDIIDGSDNSDSSDTESSSTVSEDNEDSDNASLSDKSESAESAIQKSTKSVRTKGELGFEDLPPIEDLKITVEENKCKPVGSVLNIVDTMVVVQSLPNTPPLDIDTVLFLDRGQRALGKIFDVFGPVKDPLYCVRFNSRDHIKEKNVAKEQVVYCAPQTEYTTYIHTAELLRNKGSDASWIDNNEPPVTCLDFSDDEEESRAKHSKPVVGSKRGGQIDNDLFVKRMNERNLELTARRRKEDEAKQKRVLVARRVISSPNNSTDGISMNSHSFTQYTDNYKLKTRTFTNSDQARLGNFHLTSTNSHLNKFEPAARSVNFLVGGFSSPANFAFPPQHLMCSSPGQLPNVPHGPQNYLTMYSRPPVHSPTAMPPPFSNFSTPSMPPMPAFASQPPMHPSLPPPLHPPMSQFSNFGPLPTPPLPSSLPQPNFYPRTDAPPVHQPTFIPLNVRPSISTSFHPQFVLPPPPPPPPPSMQHHPHQREVTIPRPERRTTQSSHQATSSYYPNSPYNS